MWFYGKILFELSWTFHLINHTIVHWSLNTIIHWSWTFHLINHIIVHWLGCRLKISITIFFQIWIWSLQIDLIAIFRFEWFYTIHIPLTKLREFYFNQWTVGIFNITKNTVWSLNFYTNMANNSLVIRG